jgi:hypothetical protein
MPKTILLTNSILLLCLSALGGCGVLSLLGGEVGAGRHAVLVLTVVGAACGFIMLISEVFSGIKWVPVVALTSLVWGWSAMGDQAVASRCSEVAWMVGWVSTAAWFACLAAQARENR